MALAFAVVLSWSFASHAQQASLVGVAKVRLMAMTRTVPVIGRLVARRAGDVATRVGGPLETMLVDVGTRVEKGDVMARLNVDTLGAELELAKGALLEAEADLGTATAEARLAASRLARQKRLKKSAAFSKAKFEDAENDIVVARSKIERARARIATRKAAVARRALDIRYATIVAPYDGVVIQRYAEIGGYVRNGDRLVRLLGDRTLEIEADVPSNRLGGLTDGRRVGFALIDGGRFEASVRAVLPSENPLTRTRAVRMTPHFGEPGATTPRLRLAEGQSVSVDIPVGRPRDALVVAKDAILKRGGQSIVYVIIKGVAKPRPIKLGEAIASYVEVLSGLEAGDMVVVRGNERLRPDAKVRIDKSQS